MQAGCRARGDQVKALDLDFYDRFFRPGRYLRTHAEHMRRWHAGPEGAA